MFVGGWHRGERSSLDQQRRIGLSLYVDWIVTKAALLLTPTQLLWRVAETQASRLLLVPLAFYLNQLIKSESLAGPGDMKKDTVDSGILTKAFLCIYC